MSVTHNPPVQRNLPVARLTVDHDVQRPLDKTRVDDLAGQYNPAAIGVIVVSDRADGTLHVIDGQHRVAATIAAGHGAADLPCLVYTGLSRSDEAAMFRLLNHSRGVVPLDKFRVRVIEGDPVAVSINSILEKYGWKVQAGKTTGSFGAVSAVEKVYQLAERKKISGQAVVHTVIDVVTGAWGNSADGVRAEILLGIGQVLVRHGDAVNLVKLREQLSETAGGPRGLVGRARAYRDARGGRVSDAMSEIVISLLNFKRSVNKLPGWFTQAA